MRALVPWLLVLTLLPQVENPWPTTIGIGAPFGLAVAGSVLAGVVCSKAPRSRRDDAIHRGGLWGFYIGAALYLLALLNQLVSGL
jgi:Na+/proline symporter